MVNQNEQHLRQWWDNRASTVESLPDVVGASNYPLDTGTKRYLYNKINEFLESAPCKHICLDAGCGVGLYLPTLLNKFEKVIGLDLSFGVLQKMPALLQEDDRVSLNVGSVFSLPFKEECLDGIFFRSIFQCLPSDQVLPVFIEFYRVLKPGGIAVIHFKNRHHFLYHLGRIRRQLALRKKRSISDNELPPEAEQFVPGEVYHRPWSWYLDHSQRAGFEIISQFSWQLFFWNRLERYGLSKTMETMERFTRQTKILERFIRHDGINYYALLQKE
ncbi:MAG: class I SAM-dependent methyltransferase [Anaerolineae bacterium]|nr:class I SAM-dependent methyltransferase [Anaerolineae bacterium]